jgi:hypothetical protein
MEFIKCKDVRFHANQPAGWQGCKAQHRALVGELAGVLLSYYVEAVEVTQWVESIDYKCQKMRAFVFDFPDLHGLL